MRRTTRKIGAILATFLMGESALVDGAAKEDEDLESLIGAWQGTGRFTIGKKAMFVVVTLRCRRTSGDRGVRCGLTLVSVPGMATHEETDLFGSSPGPGTYHWLSQGSEVRWVYTDVQEGRAFWEVVEIHFAGGARGATFRAETFLDGASASVFSATLTKVAGGRASVAEWTDARRRLWDATASSRRFRPASIGRWRGRAS